MLNQSTHSRVAGIDLIKQQLDWIAGGNGDLHRLSRSSISAIEQLPNCSNPGQMLKRSDLWVLFFITVVVVAVVLAALWLTD